MEARANPVSPAPVSRRWTAGPIVFSMSDTSPSDGPGTPGFDDMTRDIAEVPAVEVIVTVAVNLMSAAAVKLGLTEEGDKYKDLDEARKLVTALAGLLDSRRDRDQLLPRRPAAGRPEVAPARVPRGVARPGRAGPGPGREVHGPGLRLSAPPPPHRLAYGLTA